MDLNPFNLNPFNLNPFGFESLWIWIPSKIFEPHIGYLQFWNPSHNFLQIGILHTYLNPFNLHSHHSLEKDNWINYEWMHIQIWIVQVPILFPLLKVHTEGRTSDKGPLLLPPFMGLKSLCHYKWVKWSLASLLYSSDDAHPKFSTFCQKGWKSNVHSGNIYTFCSNFKRCFNFLLDKMKFSFQMVS